jgi:hypothetical protein
LGRLFAKELASGALEKRYSVRKSLGIVEVVFVRLSLTSLAGKKRVEVAQLSLNLFPSTEESSNCLERDIR